MNLEKMWKGITRKNSTSLFNFYFFSDCHQVTPYEVCRVKNERCSIYIFKNVKIRFLHQNYLVILKLSKQKFGNFSIFSWQCTGCGVVVGENFPPIGEYSSTIKTGKMRNALLSRRRIGLNSTQLRFPQNRVFSFSFPRLMFCFVSA